MSLSHRPNPVHSVATGPDSGAKASNSFVVRVADAIAFSSGMAAAVGASLSLAAGLALAAPEIHLWIFLTAAGTFIIYNLDRLRDLEHDRMTSPMRTAFVSKHHLLLYGLVIAAAVGFGAGLLVSPPASIILCLAIGLIGLFHRRMKRTSTLKAFYVSASWVAACVGLPWLASLSTEVAAWVAGVFFSSLTANLIASNLRDGEVIRISGGHHTILWVARLFIILALVIAIAAPNGLLALAWIPGCEGIALIFFRPTERYGHLVIDGALLVGALATSIQLAWLAQ